MATITQSKYLRRIDTWRIDSPLIFAFSNLLMVQGNFRPCDIKGNLLQFGNTPWLDQYNNVHDSNSEDESIISGELSKELGVDLKSKDHNNIKKANPITIKKNFIEQFWLPNYIINQLGERPDACEILWDEIKWMGLDFHSMNSKVSFRELVGFYKLHRKRFMELKGQKDNDEFEEKNLMQFAKDHKLDIEKFMAIYRGKQASDAPVSDIPSETAKKPTFRRKARFTKESTIKKTLSEEHKAKLAAGREAARQRKAQAEAISKATGKPIAEVNVELAKNEKKEVSKGA